MLVHGQLPILPKKLDGQSSELISEYPLPQDRIVSSATHRLPAFGSRFGLANGKTVRQGRSDIDALGDVQSVFEFNAEVTHCAVDLDVTEQQLHCPQIAGLSTNLRYLRTAERMRAVCAWLQPNRRHPIADEPTVLAG